MQPVLRSLLCMVSALHGISTCVHRWDGPGKNPSSPDSKDSEIHPEFISSSYSHHWVRMMLFLVCKLCIASILNVQFEDCNINLTGCVAPSLQKNILVLIGFTS